MAAVLALVFRRRLRLVPLAVALGAVALTFGLMALTNAPLTMASIAVLPVLLGLGVDYAIQYQARIPDPPTARRRGAGRAHGGADARDRGARDRGRLPRAAALAGADGARVRRSCWCSASASRFALALTGGTAALVALGARRRARGLLGRSARGASELLAPWAGRSRASARARGGSARARAAPGGRAPRARARGRARARRGSAGSSTRAPRCAPTCASSFRRTSRRCATSTCCSARPAWPARSTSWSRGAT